MSHAHTRLLKQVELKVNQQHDARGWTNPVGYDREKRITYGLCKGSLDIVVIQNILIRPEHVGKTIGVFHIWDTKTGDYGRLSPEQKDFSRTITRFGGVAGVIREIDDVDYLLNLWR